MSGGTDGLLAAGQSDGSPPAGSGEKEVRAQPGENGLRARPGDDNLIAQPGDDNLLARLGDDNLLARLAGGDDLLAKLGDENLLAKLGDENLLAKLGDENLLAKLAGGGATDARGRIALDPDRVERDLARLVLALVEFLRQLMELQAVRRMEAGSLSPEEEERLGLTLMRAAARIRELAAAFGLSEADLVLDLGPLGRL